MVIDAPLVPARLVMGVLFTWGLCWEECCGKPGAGLPRGKRGPGGSDEQVGTVGLGLSPHGCSDDQLL